MLEERVNRIFINNRTRPLFQMSEQAIVDCIWSVGTDNFSGLHGCDGGFADETMSRIITDFGGKLPRLADYPYQAQDMVCNKSAWTFDEVVLQSFSRTSPGSLGELKYALLSGPVTVGISVIESMVFYAGGIYNDPACTSNTSTINHQVVAVGYGTDEASGRQYWIIRNSWSNAWGIDGYIYIQMDYNIDYCGVTLQTNVPNFGVPN